MQRRVEIIIPKFGAFQGLCQMLQQTKDNHSLQQVSDFPQLSNEEKNSNAIGLMSLDLLTSEAMQNNTQLRFNLQNEIGPLTTTFDGKSI
jgi:hypothetical protein